MEKKVNSEKDGKEVHTPENGFVLTSRRTENGYIIIKHEQVGGDSIAFEGFVPDYGYVFVKRDVLEDSTLKYSGIISDSGKYERINDNNFETGIYCMNYLEKEFNSLTTEEEKAL